MPRPRSPLPVSRAVARALVAGVLLASGAAAEGIPNLKLRLVHKGRHRDIPQGAAGLARATALLTRLQGPGYAKGATWSILDALANDPVVRAEITHAAALAAPRAILVELHPRGDVDPFEEKADDDSSVIRMGETAMLEEDRTTRLATFVHEVGHASDPDLCEGGYAEGPDEQHYSAEVVSPAMAFQEGFANYLGAHVPGSELAREAAAPPAQLVVELPKKGRRPAWVKEVDDDGHGVIPEAALAARHFLANETWVAALLTRLEALPPGRDGVDRAYLATTQVPCRHLGTMLAAYVVAFPDHRSAVEGLLAGIRVGDRPLLAGATLAALLERGALPDGLEGGDGPRVDLAPPPPARAPAAPAGGLFGLFDP